MLEKPMAADLAGAEALLAAARAARLPLMVNWPTAWRPALRHGLALARAGEVGEPVQLSHRGGHAGPREYGCSPQFVDWLYDPRRNGAGALVDYCGYGGLLCRLLLGRPDAVTAVAAHLRKLDHASEDNAIVILSYPRALGLLEASWVEDEAPHPRKYYRLTKAGARRLREMTAEWRAFAEKIDRLIAATRGGAREDDR